VSTSAAVKIGVVSPLVALFLLVIVTVVSVLSRASESDDDIKSRPLKVVFPLAALVGGSLLAATNALLALVFGAEVAHAALAGAAAGALSSPLLLAGLLVGFSATLSFALPFLLDVGALLLVPLVW
jgi:hypothetical protein